MFAIFVVSNYYLRNNRSQNKVLFIKNMRDIEPYNKIFLFWISTTFRFSPVLEKVFTNSSRFERRKTLLHPAIDLCTWRTWNIIASFHQIWKIASCKYDVIRRLKEEILIWGSDSISKSAIMETSTKNAKITDSGYSNSCSNSQSQKRCVTKEILNNAFLFLLIYIWIFIKKIEIIF